MSKALKREENISKRVIASEVAQIFDPLGFLSPVVLRAKLLLQQLWLYKLSWDEPLPPQITQHWYSIRKHFTYLARITISRSLNTTEHSVMELHGFLDASQLAMPAVIYIKVLSPSAQVQPVLICVKTKVAPLKRLSIPRLELTAALLLSKLTQYIQNHLNMKISSISTDSTVTLTWIKSHSSRWKDFVRNRVSKIQELTPSVIWRFVQGSHNPANCASRGVSVTQLEAQKLWWTGPSWLSKSSGSQPTQPLSMDDSSAQEARPGVSLVVVTPKADYNWKIIYNYSTLIRLLRVTTTIIRAIQLFKRENTSKKTTYIHTLDLEKATLF